MEQIINELMVIEDFEDSKTIENDILLTNYRLTDLKERQIVNVWSPQSGIIKCKIIDLEYWSDNFITLERITNEK